MDNEGTLTSATSPSLLARVKLHDPHAWERMSAIYVPLVYQWTRRCRLPEEDAADVVQEVFGVLLRRVQEFSGQGRFRGWLWTITRNKIRDHIRRRQKQAIAAGGSTANQHLQQLSDDAPEPWSTGEEQSAAEQGVTARTVESVRAEFESKTWQAFWMFVVETRTVAEISVALGITKHAVHQSKYRVLRRLREEFEGLE